jgi:3-phenylpropionate/trans-cinnamate dioxygenase ferredoxin reductase subunit
MHPPMVSSDQRPDVCGGGAVPFLILYDGRRIRLEAWRNARDQGAIATANMLGAGVTYDAVPSFWSDQYELTLRIAGLTDAAATSISRDLGEGLRLTFHLANDGRLVAASSIGPDSKIAKKSAWRRC